MEDSTGYPMLFRHGPLPRQTICAHPDRPHYAKGLCRSCYNKMHQRKIMEAAHHRYNNSEPGRRRAERYNATEKGKARRCRYIARRRREAGQAVIDIPLFPALQDHAKGISLPETS